MDSNNRTIKLIFDKVPNHCGECSFYKSTIYNYEGFNINYCPFGASSFDCVIARPDDCPIGGEVHIHNFDKEGNFDFS